MIRLENVTKRYPGGQEALSGLDLSVDNGEMAFVTGHSGAGKSTLLRLIALIERPSSGQVIVDNQNIRRVKRRKIPAYRRQIGMVFQDHKLLYDRPVFDNVALPLIIAGVSHRDAGRRVRAALDQVGLLNKEKKSPETLSAGEQQRVGIARAIVTRPKLLIADEPTGNLDPDLSLEVMRIFRRFNEVGVTVLVASHDISLIDRLGCPSNSAGGRPPATGDRPMAVTRNADAVAPVRARGPMSIWATRHVSTAIGSLGRLARQPFASLMIILVIAVTLALPASINLIVKNAMSVSGSWDNALDFSVFLEPSLSLGEAENLGKLIGQRADVELVDVISAEDALADFKQQSGFGEALEQLPDNPLPHAIVVRPSAGNTSASLVLLQEEISNLPETDHVQVDTEWVRRFHAILDIVRQAIMIGAALLGIAIVVVIGNTIRLDIENRRDEIEVTKLIGASNAFVRRPFLWTGFWYGLFGGLMALALVQYGLFMLKGPVARLSGLYQSNISIVSLNLTEGTAIVGLGVFLGLFASWFTAARHMRKIEPR